MKKALAALAAVAALVGIALSLFFGVFADRGGGQTSAEALALGLYGQEASGPWPCDDISDIVSPPGADRFPPVAAVVEAADLGPLIEIPGSGVAALAARRAKEGQPYASDNEALKESEDGVLLYISIVRQGDPDVVVSQDEARAYLQAHPPGPCEAGGTVRVGGVTDSQLIRGVQIGETTNNFIQQAMQASARSGSIPSMGSMDQTIAEMIAGARPTVKITEIAFSAAEGLECTEGGAKVACPAGLPTAPATPTPAAKP